MFQVLCSCLLSAVSFVPLLREERESIYSSGSCDQVWPCSPLTDWNTRVGPFVSIIVPGGFHLWSTFSGIYFQFAERLSVINGRMWFLHNSTRTCVTLCGISLFYVFFVRQFWRKFFKWKYFYFCSPISCVGFRTETNYWFVSRLFCLSRVSDYFSSLLLCWFCSLNASLWMNKKRTFYSREFRLKRRGSTHSTN